MSGLRRTTRREPVYGEQGNRLVQLTRQRPGDPFFSNVTWLLKMEGANAGTLFTDSSSYIRSSTAYGAAQTSTTQKKSGSTSGSFNGTNSHIRTTATTDLQLTGDFTIETWVYPNSTADMQLASSQATNNTQIFRLNESATGRLSLYDGSANVFLSVSAGITASTWQHIAFARTGTTTRAFVNGSIVATNSSWSGTLRCDVIGSGWFLGAGTGWANAYIDEFRITKGVCRYTSAFLPLDSFPTS